MNFRRYPLVIELVHVDLVAREPGVGHRSDPGERGDPGAARTAYRGVSDHELGPFVRPRGDRPAQHRNPVSPGASAPFFDGPFDERPVHGESRIPYAARD